MDSAAKVHTLSAGPVGVDDVGGLSSSRLAAVYQEIADAATPPEARADRTTLERLVSRALTVRLARAKHRTRPGNFDLACTGRVRTHKPGTKRDRLINVLRRGATLDECSALFGWGIKITRDQIYMLHTDLGYGLRDDDGRIYLVESRTRPIETRLNGRIRRGRERWLRFESGSDRPISLSEAAHEQERLGYSPASYEGPCRFRTWSMDGHYVASWECRLTRRRRRGRM